MMNTALQQGIPHVFNNSRGSLSIFSTDAMQQIKEALFSLIVGKTNFYQNMKEAEKKKRKEQP